MYEHQTTKTVRFFRRTQDPSMGLFPWGLLGLLLILLPLLFGLFWFAKNSIQEHVRSGIQEELVLNNLEWVDVDVDGQGVRLSGEGSKLAGEKAITIAKQVKGDTWLGPLVAPISVQGDFVEKSSAVKAVAKPVKKAPVPTPKPAAKPIWGKVIATLESGIFTLNGVVGSQTEKAALLKLARQGINPPRLKQVVDQLTVSPVALIAGSDVLAKRTVDGLVSCNSGQANAIDGVYTINCQARYDNADKIKAVVTEPLSKGKLGKVLVSTAQHCNTSFENLLAGKSIGFAISSANLKASSSALIDKVAALAKVCSGTIRVEGHTDDTGSFDANMALSRARAESVVSALVERGIEQQRLKPDGFGPTKPRAKGKTRAARTLNRRIEFKVSE